MKRIILAAVLGASLALAACSTVTPKDPAQAVYQAQGDYLAALTAAVKYKQLPPCGQPSSPTLCSDPALVVRLQNADDLAYAALNAAQSMVRTPNASSGPVNLSTVLQQAQVAVQAFATAVAATGGK